jgi:autotransporter-associated beta strand protein
LVFGGTGGFGANSGDSSGRGGDGLGAGGAAFVRLGGTLTLIDPVFTGTISAAGGAQPQGIGQGLFMGGTTTINVSGSNVLTFGTNDFLGGSAINNLNDPNGRGLLVKAGTGTLILSGSSSMHGGTQVNAGRLVVNNDTALGGANALVDTNRISNGGTLEIAAGHTVNASVTVDGGGKFIINGTYQPYAFTANSGALVGGAGTVSSFPITIGGGAQLSPGENNQATLTFATGLTLGTGAILDMELGTASDLIRVSGGNFIGPSGTGGVTVYITNAGGLVVGQNYVLINWNGATASGVDLTDFVLGAGSLPGTFSMSGNTLLFDPSASAPEPGTLTLVALAAAGALAGWGRKYRRAKQ